MSLFGSKKPDVELEVVPPGESRRIENMAELTRRQLDEQYRDSPCLRAVHPKDHGCVEASFVVGSNLPDEHRVGIFKEPGRIYQAAIRFSNATGALGPDGPRGPRGMAIKLYGVDGDRLADDGEDSQDFLMINQPVFVFANAEDYEALMSLGRDGFFKRTPPDAAAGKRTARSGMIAQHAMGALRPPAPFPFPAQAPPRSPLDNVYFSAAPFMFGKGKAMKFRAVPVNPDTRPPADTDDNYLRKAMLERMTAAGGKDICFDFQVQVRDSGSLDPATDIEDVCTLWDEKVHRFETVARINIGPQKIDSPERVSFCEKLFFSPWHALKAHRPLGGINRVRRAVYSASSKHRGCPVSPRLPAAPRRR